MTKQQAFLLREADLPRADRGNGSTTTRLVNRSCGSQLMINGMTTILAKGTIPLHYYNCEESVLVLSGTGRAVVGEIELAGKPGDVTWIPANLPHQFLNGSATDSMRIVWTDASAGATRIMLETGKTHPIDADHKA